MGFGQNRPGKDLSCHKEATTAMDAHLSQKTDNIHRGAGPPERRSWEVVRARSGVPAPQSGNGKEGGSKT